MATSRLQLLQRAIRLVPEHGFTCQALALSAVRATAHTAQSLPASKPQDAQDQLHAGPLSENAIEALFGSGDDARRSLIAAWLEDARAGMGAGNQPAHSVSQVLKTRLDRNTPVLQYLPEAFALLATPTTARLSLPLPPLDPTQGLAHIFKVADEACHVARDPATGMEWYARRATLAAIYGAAELHQLASPNTAGAFLDSMLESSTRLHQSVAEVGLFAGYVGRSWAGIIRSAGLN